MQLREVWDTFIRCFMANNKTSWWKTNRIQHNTKRNKKKISA